MYTFNDQLTTDQKLAHIREWIAAGEVARAEVAPDGPRADPEQHSDLAEHVRMLQDWEQLVHVEEELALSRADLDDPDPDGDRMQEGWCRRMRLQLRIGGLRRRLRAEAASLHPSPARIARLQERIAELDGRLGEAEDDAEGDVMTDVAHSLAGMACEGKGCTRAHPCTPCACRKVLAAGG